MIYSFRCDGCSNEVDIDRPMADAGNPANCRICTSPMRRLFNSYSHCDEVRGTYYRHPTKGVMVKDHGKYFDVGAGWWVHSKSERRNLMKRDGLTEVGGSMV